MKYFILSDIHSFAKQMKSALKAAGFNKKNKDHTLIVCGDVFDRGPDAFGVYNYLKSIPKKRCILIRGNHECLFFDLLEKDFPERHDFSNCTVDTFCQISQISSNLLNMDTYDYDPRTYYAGSRSAWEDIKNDVRNHEITKWLQSSQWVDYYELGNYIFVHSFIPVTVLDNKSWYEIENRKLEFNPDWRNATANEWEDATWGCPWKQYHAGLFKPEEDNGKVLVCGHWHTFDFYSHLDNNNKYLHQCGPIYYSKHLIGLDGGVTYNYLTEMYVHPQNLLVIEDINSYDCYDKHHNKLNNSK